MKCKDCKYSQPTEYKTKSGGRLTCCMLTRLVYKEETESDCSYFNADLSLYKICYNCKYYIGGGDWGLFCSHKEKYHHLGKFKDDGCEYFEWGESNGKA